MGVPANKSIPSIISMIRNNQIIFTEQQAGSQLLFTYRHDVHRNLDFMVEPGLSRTFGWGGVLIGQ